MFTLFSNTDTYLDIYGQVKGPFYVASPARFQSNCDKFESLLNSGNHEFKLSYSVKTNYLPAFLKSILNNEGRVEVVSEMELELVIRLGFHGKDIILNGPIKSSRAIELAIQNDILINIDGLDDLSELLKTIDGFQRQTTVRVGVRINHDIQGKESRFGASAESGELFATIEQILLREDLELVQIHAHFQERSLSAWKEKSQKLVCTLKTLKERFNIAPEEVNFGGGFFGPMRGQILEAFVGSYASYEEYSSILLLCAEKIQHALGFSPTFYIEPGTAVVADAMEYVCRVYSVKKVGGQFICTVDGSSKDIAAHSGRVPTDYTVVGGGSHTQDLYEELTIVGNTCLERDVITTLAAPTLGRGDLVVFPYCGAYSIVMRPSFIHLMPPIYMPVDGSRSNFACLKSKETLDDVFSSYKFFVEERSK